MRRSSSTCRDNASNRDRLAARAGRSLPPSGPRPHQFPRIIQPNVTPMGGSRMSDQSEKSDQANRLDEDLLVTGDRPLSIPGELPVLPLRDTVLFPNSFMPLAVAREASVRL